MTDSDYLIWVDLEMTGLDPEQHRIVEIASIITDSDLNIVSEGPDLVIHQPEDILDKMNDWCDEHHRESGLLTEIRNSTISVSEAEAQTLDYLKTYIEPGTAPLCGNSIGQDRRFLYEYMPRLTHFLHYRNIDVSSVKELVKRWYPSDYHAPEKEGNHRANDDIRESIEELRWYRQMVFLEH